MKNLCLQSQERMLDCNCTDPKPSITGDKKMSKATLKEIFEAALEEDLSKNEIIERLYKEGNIDITLAVREYTKLAREAGIVLTSKERREKINETLEGYVDSLADSEVRSSLAEQFSSEYDIAIPTAAQHIRDFCEEKGIELPTVQRTPFKDIIAFVQKARDEGEERADTVKRMAEQFNFTENSAASAYSKVLKELGLSQTSAVKVSLKELVHVIRANLNKPKADAIKIVSEATGYSETTTKQFFSQIPFAKEWLKQQMAEDAEYAEQEVEETYEEDEAA